MARILCVDDDASILDFLERLLSKAGHECVRSGNVGEAFHLLTQSDVDLILSDFQLQGIDGLEFLQMLRSDRNTTPFILLTGHGGVDHAMVAVRAGADDYLMKPFNGPELLHRIELILEKRRLHLELEVLRQETKLLRSERPLLGKSAAIRQVLDIIAAAAPSRATVLIEGESGTGKELIAREIHEQSERRSRPFIQVNCAALPEGLIESALFGHEKGAFTGAIRRAEGAFERADGGSLLLDEVSEMRLDLQAKLLRVLQEREFERVGGSAVIKSDVRVIATTNRDLRAAAEAGTFRKDLYYRLHVIGIVAPPLREHLADVPLLAQHFASQSAAEMHKVIDGIDTQAIDLLQSYSWPGNVRELQHVVERAVVLATRPVLDVDSFDEIRSSVRGWPRRVLVARAVADGESTELAANIGGIILPSLNLEAASEALIHEALRLSNDNRTHAAALLGIGVRTLRKKLNAPDARGHADDDAPPTTDPAGTRLVSPGR